jgi:hypothetical protein
MLLFDGRNCLFCQNASYSLTLIPDQSAALGGSGFSVLATMMPCSADVVNCRYFPGATFTWTFGCQPVPASALAGTWMNDQGFRTIIFISSNAWLLAWT